MTIGAKSVKTTKTYSKIARGRYNKWVKPVITSQAMLQNKRCHLQGCVHEYSGVIRQFCGKTETKFCTTHSKICISLALCRFSDDFHSITGRNRLNFKRPFTTTQMLSTERGSGSHIWSMAKTALHSDRFRILHSDQIQLILVQSGFDRSLIWKRICLKGTPQIRNPDPDPPQGTHPKCQSRVLRALINTYCRGCF